MNRTHIPALLLTWLASTLQPAQAQQAGDTMSVDQMLNALTPSETGEGRPRRTRNLRPVMVDPANANAAAASVAASAPVSGLTGNTGTPATTVSPQPSAVSPATNTVSTASNAPSLSVTAPANPAFAAAVTAPSSPVPAVTVSAPAGTATAVAVTAPAINTTASPAVPASAVTATTPTSSTSLTVNPPAVAAPALDLSILFELGSAKISKASIPTLEKLALVLRNERLADSQFRIEGHTDSSGNAAANMALSTRRAQSVMDFLAVKGVDTGRMEAIGKGSTELLLPDQPQSFRNRRVRVAVMD